jgi:micrococcal nuclease
MTNMNKSQLFWGVSSLIFIITLGGLIFASSQNLKPGENVFSSFLDQVTSLGFNTSSTESKTQTTSKTTAKKAPAKGEVEEVEVERARDGDTVELTDGRAVRLLNVDTPETVKKDSPVMCYGPEASEYTKKTLVKGKKIFMTIDKEPTDRYNRDLRFIYFEREDAVNQAVEKSYNAYLIKEGYGRAAFYSPNTTYRKQMVALQQEAETAKKGLWGKCTLEQSYGK